MKNKKKPLIICKICGKTFEKERYSWESRNICGSECFRKNHWNEIVKNKTEHVIIDGKCYFIGSEDEIKGFKGFNGNLYQIEFNDGKKIKTTNLWYQGKVPDEYLVLLPNTAKFIVQ